MDNGRRDDPPFYTLLRYDDEDQSMAKNASTEERASERSLFRCLVWDWDSDSD